MTLLGYELKKILRRPFTLVVCIGCIGLLAFFVLSLQLQHTAYVWDGGEGYEVLTGRKAIQHSKELYEKVSGEWDEQRFHEVVEEYLAFVNDENNYTSKLDEYTMAYRGYSFTSQGMSEEDLVLYNEANPVYEKAPHAQWGDWQLWAHFEDIFERHALNSDGSIKTMAEVYPTVDQPAQFTYTQGVSYLCMMQLIGVAIFGGAMILAGIAPIFCEEISHSTEPALLSAKHGRGKLVRAKLAASALYSAGVVTLLTLLLFALIAPLQGLGGLTSPIQFSLDFSGVSVPFTFIQLILATFGLQLLGALAFAGIILVLSALFHSAFQTVFVGAVWLIAVLACSSMPFYPLNLVAQIVAPGQLMPMLHTQYETPLWALAIAVHLLMLAGCCIFTAARYKYKR